MRNNFESRISNHEFRNFGFTLIELLVVISIIGILLGLGAVSYTTAQQKGRDAKRKGDMKVIQNAFEQYYSLNTRYPKDSTEGDLTMQGGLPDDPKNTDPFTYTVYYDATDGSGYCACARLELGGGNATAVPSSTSCPFGSGDYFCVESLQ